MPSRARYKLIGIGPDRVVEQTIVGAPPETSLCRWGTLKKVPFVVRYFPSRKKWVILDIRHVGQVWTSGAVRATRLERTFTNEDAAVMYVMHLLSCMPRAD